MLTDRLEGAFQQVVGVQFPSDGARVAQAPVGLHGLARNDRKVRLPRQIAGHVGRQAVCKSCPALVAAQIFEWQNRNDRRLSVILSNQAWSGGLALGSCIDQDPVDLDRLGDTLHFLVAEGGKADRQLSSDLVASGSRNGDSSRFRQPLQSICNVHHITVNIVTLNENVAEVDANAEIKPPFWRDEFVDLRFLLLDFYGAAKGVDHTAELDQYPIAHRFDQPTMVRSDPWLEYFLQVCLEVRPRAFFVDTAQTAIADDICNQDGCKVTLHVGVLLVDRFSSLQQLACGSHVLCGAPALSSQHPLRIILKHHQNLIFQLFSRIRSNGLHV